MNYNLTNMYDLDPHIAEIYDQSEMYREDVDLLLALIDPQLLPSIFAHEWDVTAQEIRSENGGIEGGRLIHILEPFCGTGRILIPLAQAGYVLVGLDQAGGMLDRARQKLSLLPEEIQNRVMLHQADVIAAEWPSGFDLVILGGNCLYELATPEEQEQVIRSAAVALNLGGNIYVDNDHMEGELAPAWQQSGIRTGFPSGVCGNGTRVESTTETIWFDIPARLVRFRRTTRVYQPESSDVEHHACTALLL
jgi:SAM-dependent methyltransferase